MMKESSLVSSIGSESFRAANSAITDDEPMLIAFSSGPTELKFASISDRGSSQEMFNFGIQISSRLQRIRIPIGARISVSLKFASGAIEVPELSVNGIGALYCNSSRSVPSENESARCSKWKPGIGKNCTKRSGSNRC